MLIRDGQASAMGYSDQGNQRFCKLLRHHTTSTTTAGGYGSEIGGWELDIRNKMRPPLSLSLLPDPASFSLS